VETDTYFHVKYTTDRSASARSRSEDEESRSANIGQAIFHRPASSGIYAIVLNIETARIGFNDLAQRYAVDESERLARLKALLESVLYTFVEPAGAMRSTQNPHIVDLSGAIAISRDVVPAPCISPLKPTFAAEIEQVASAINTVRPSAVGVTRFTSMGEFAQAMAVLIQKATPYRLAIDGA